jgi:Fur family ferric uptake transcriptional regulator
MAVLERLDAASAPLSHGEVAALLAPSGVDRATVYRNLVDLVEAGLARRSDLGDHVWRFERTRPARAGGGGHAANHPHFVCVDCGTVSCLPEGSVRVRGGPGWPRALSRRLLEVQLRGRCDQCAG